MSTDLFQALTLGLLVIIILALLVTVSMLGRVRAALENRASTGPGPSPAGEDTVEAVSPEPSPTASVDAVDDAPAALDEPVATDEPVNVNEPTTAGGGAETIETDQPSDSAPDEDSERPFERGGRWYFRRGGELLVYEEGTGEWVPVPGGGEARPAVTSHVETVAASTEPSPAEAGDDSGAATAEPAESLEPSTSFAGQPLASAEENVAALGDGDAIEGDGSAVATAFEEPGGGTIVPEDAPEEATAQPSESFWRCSSCGAVNGSTATSCRMCFAPKP